MIIILKTGQHLKKSKKFFENSSLVRQLRFSFTIVHFNSGKERYLDLSLQRISEARIGSVRDSKHRDSETDSATLSKERLTRFCVNGRRRRFRISAIFEKNWAQI